MASENIVKKGISNELIQIQLQNIKNVNLDEILESVSDLKQNYSKISSMHLIYLDIIKDIQINLIQKIKDNKFEEPYFIAKATIEFVQEIEKDLRLLSNSQINKQISKFVVKNPKYENNIVNSKAGLRLLFDFVVNQMSNTEDRLRAIAIAKAGKSDFTQKDKKQIISTLTIVIYQHVKIIKFSDNWIGNAIEKIFENILKVGIRYISLNHINKSISISRDMINQK